VYKIHVLYDDNPIALCEQVRVKLHSEYNILGIRPLLKGDEPKSNQDGAAFYPWFHVHAIDNALPSKAVIDQFQSGMEATMFQC
jgi:hypothetical protein